MSRLPGTALDATSTSATTSPEVCETMRRTVTPEPKSRSAGVNQALAGAREGGGVGDRLQLGTRLEFVVSGAALHYDFAVVFSTAGDVGRNQPASIEPWRSHSGAPCRPLRSVQGSIFRQII